MSNIDTQLERAGAQFRRAGDALPDAVWDEQPQRGSRRAIATAVVAAGAVILLAVPVLFLGASPRTMSVGGGAPVTSAAGETPPAGEIATTTTSIEAVTSPTLPPDIEFDPTGRLHEWDWVNQVAVVSAGQGSFYGELPGPRHKLATVQEQVPAIGAAGTLAYRATEWYEDAFFLLADGSNTMVYVGWNELESTDPASADAFTDPGIDPVVIYLPLIDSSMQQGIQDDVLVLDRVTDRAVDFVADTSTIVATVRFFQLADTYASTPIAIRSDEMAGIANAVFAALDLPKNRPGDLAPPQSRLVPPVDMATLVTDVAEGIEIPPVVVCAPDHPPIVSDTGDSVAYETPVAALEGFLEGATGENYLPLPRSNYTELHTPDGSIVFVAPSQSDPAMAIAWIAVDETASGWTVESWKTAGC